MLLLKTKVLSLTGYLACLFLLCNTIHAQNFNIKTFTTQEGLPNNNVKTTAVDSSGFLWIATWDGLSRYDGYSFKNYYHKTDDSLSLPYFSINTVLIDGGNNLWLMTDDGQVARYDRNNDLFKRIDHLFGNLPQSYTYISVDESGYLWLINPDCFYRFDFRKGDFNKYELSDNDGNPIKIISNLDYSVSTSEPGKVWLVYDTSYEFDITPANKLVLIKEYSVDLKNLIEGKDFSFFYWFRIYFSESGRKWIFSNAGLFLLDEKTGIFNPYTDPFPVNDFQGKGYLFWSWEDDGIYFFDQNETRLFHIQSQYCQLVKGIMCQNRNLIWFSNCSMTGASLGLNRVVITPDYFKTYPLLAEKNDIPAVFAVTKDRKNNIWAGIRGKSPLVQINDEMKIKKLEIPDFSTVNDPGTVRSLIATNEGLWIGFFRDLLLFYNFGSEEFTRYNPESSYFRPAAIDKDGRLYLCGGYKGYDLILFSPRLNRTERKISDFSDGPIYKILIDKNGIVWAGSNKNTLLRYDPQEDKTETIPLSKDKYNIEDICEGDSSDLWLALLGGGVCNFKPETGRRIFYRTSDGLSNNMTYGILKDKTGNIWVSTNTGISRINPETGIIRSFGTNEGLNIIEFNSGAAYVSDDGEFFMGGMGGLVGFYPEILNRDELEKGDQKIIISEIRVSGKEKPFKRSVCCPDTLILNKGENNFKVYFSSTDFIHSDLTMYRYRLSKINENWLETDSRNRNTNYANLRPGWYNFELQATDRIGNWCESKNLIVKIKPFYYQTLIFRIAVPALFLLLVTSMVFIYIRQLKQRESQKQDALRLQSIQGQMNPHFIFNSLNSINYFISENDPVSANRYIADFSKLIRSILHNFNSDFISLEREIESLEEYLKIEHLRFGDKFNYRIILDPEIQHGLYKVSPGLIQPFIENAIWHGVRGLEKRKGHVSVSFRKESEKLICIVEDDGIGRKQAENAKSKIDQKKSKGISLVTERLRIINNLHKSNYKIIISDLYPEKQDTGTRAVIEIPVKKN